MLALLTIPSWIATSAINPRCTFTSSAETTGCALFCTVDLEQRNVNPAVLVDVAEFVQNPQIGLGRVIPSSVRLQALDLCTSHYGDASQGALGDFVTETFGISTDGERRVISGLCTRRGGEFTCKVIKGTSEVLETVPDDVRDLPRKIRSNESYSVSARIGPDFILGVFEVPVDSGLERIMMFLGPAELQATDSGIAKSTS